MEMYMKISRDAEKHMINFVYIFEGENMLEN